MYVEKAVRDNIYTVYRICKRRGCGKPTDGDHWYCSRECAPHGHLSAVEQKEKEQGNDRLRKYLAEERAANLKWDPTAKPSKEYL